MSIVDKIKWRLKRFNLAYVANKLGYQLVPKGLGYFKVQDVVPKAQASGKSLCEYLETENAGGVGKRRDDIIAQLHANGVFSNAKHILEIGAGTGIYLEKSIELAKPTRFEVYETALDWTEYLKQTHSHSVTEFICHNANGRSLSFTANNSVDLVTAHAVFVYIPLLATMRYLEECVRVMKPGGLLAFDVFSDSVFDYTAVKKWNTDGHGYVFPVIVPEKILLDFAQEHALTLLTSFRTVYHSSGTMYYIFQKN